jgi:hypothetical protein
MIEEGVMRILEIIGEETITIGETEIGDVLVPL